MNTSSPLSARRASIAYWTASVGIIVLPLFLAAWELQIAPLRPNGSWLVLKALPLCFAIPGILKQRLYTYQWASMLIWLYACEGVVRGMSDPVWLSRWMGWTELALSLVFFAGVVIYARPFKQAALADKRRRAQQIDDQYADTRR